jgi:hypothetical protein
LNRGVVKQLFIHIIKYLQVTPKQHRCACQQKAERKPGESLGFRRSEKGQMGPRGERKISWKSREGFQRIMLGANKSDLIHVADTTYPKWWDNPDMHFLLGSSLL